MQALKFILTALVIVALGFGVYLLYHWYLRRRYAEVVDPAELMDHIRRVQVVDVREPDEFDRKHILGARNMPSSQFKLLYPELRRDTPIYLYCETQDRSSRCAKILSQNGYEDVYILKGGIDQWYGKTKSNQ